jgi:hypothetical protein
MLDGVKSNLARCRELRRQPLDNAVTPPIYFNPVLPGMAIDRGRPAADFAPRSSRRSTSRERNIRELGVRHYAARWS